jgi:hypothetical protein
MIDNQHTERILSPDRETQRALDNLQMAAWIQRLAPWQVMGHFTWRDKLFYYRDGSSKACGVKQETARRYYEKFMDKEFPRLSYFYAIEENPSRDGHHIHALFSDCKTLYRKEMWSLWFEKFGRNKVEPVNCNQDVVDYVTKYVTKDSAWWNVKLQWHRIQSLNQQGFSLRPELLSAV